MRVAIVGAGIAGLSCAEELRSKGCTVRLYDKGRGLGGRMATRRVATELGEASFDHGAQYFTARDPAFSEQVNRWNRDGLAERWPVAGEDAWVGTPGMNSLIKAMAASQDVVLGVRIESIERLDKGWKLRHAAAIEGPFDALVLAIPAEQSAALLSLHDFGLARIALHARSQPCWSGLFAFDKVLAAPDTPIRDTGIISWAVRDSAKPGRQGPEAWLVQAQPDWTRQWLESDSQWVAEQLLESLGEALGLSDLRPVAATAHRWRFAMSSGTGDGALWCAEKKLGACGDWLLGPRVECAWLSGRVLAQRMLEGQSVASGQEFAQNRAGNG
jgi:renalase